MYCGIYSRIKGGYMKDLELNTGIIELAIQGDKSRVLRFNPTDANTIDGFCNLVNNINVKLAELAGEEERIIKSDLPDLEKIRSRNKLSLKIDRFFREELDLIFGAGTSNLVFEDLCTSALTGTGEFVFINFIYAILPYFEEEMDERTKKLNASAEEVKKIIQEHRAQEVRRG